MKKLLGRWAMATFMLAALVLLGACSSPTAGPQSTVKPIFTDADVDAAPLREFARADIQGFDDDSLSATLDDMMADESSLSDASVLTTQTVVPGLPYGGYVAYIVVDWHDEEYPYQVWVHDVWNDSYSWIYGGGRQVDSVAVSYDYCNIGIIMASEYDANSWINNGYQNDVYRIATDACFGFGYDYMERLTQSPANEQQLSMDYSGYIWAWETDHLTNPNYARGVLIRNFWSGRDLFLAHNSEQTHPSLSYYGDYVVLVRQVGNRYDIYRFNVGNRRYTRFIRGVSGAYLSHPSISYDGSQVMFIQRDGNGDKIRTRILGQGIRNRYSSCYDCISHAYMEANGEYYVYNTYDSSSGYHHYYMRAISSGLVVDAGVSNNAPYTDFLQSFWNP
ncbi:MAG: hypothetical protein R2880_18815 [Deinococcales bacterium]